MLKSFLSLVFVVASQASLATDLNAPRLSAHLVEIESNHLFLDGASYGAVEINQDEGVVTLRLQKPWTCKQGLFCATVMPAPIELKMPLVAIEEDGCGIQVYTAQLHSQDEEGPFNQIQVFDYSNLICRIYKPFPTRVVLSTWSGVDQPAVESQFFGETLIEKLLPAVVWSQEDTASF